MASVKKDFTVERDGKTIVLYKGLLDLAHESGLRSIQTDLIQLPDEANGRVAVVKARVYMTDDRLFEAYGDANPGNAKGPGANALIRFAETRAKARALRDAVNVGDVSVEELDDDEPARQPQARPAAGNGHSQTPVNAQPAQAPAGNGRAALTAEYRAVWKQARDAGIEPYRPSTEEFDAWDDRRVRIELTGMREALAKRGAA